MTAPPRFSSDELVDIINTTRMRSTVTRDSGPDHDAVDLVIPHMPGSTYRFARDNTGWTYLLHVAPDQVKPILRPSVDLRLHMHSDRHQGSAPWPST